ncbi:uncharacterized protein LOC110178684 [Drosophila serrata]|uniref:uncharacterized protein LOC110178684 n=1 Tax=Drosophila serrata TaxID=7274 RepID=UPI000A1D3216|nr:uncharacterized protein LOC110178684 [Drosophila serrata]
MGKRVEKRRGKPWLCGLPLVIFLILGAPAPAVTSLAALPKDDAVGDAAFAANILEVAEPNSAVQDWSLLCKELCGAGLGVASTPGGAKDTILRPEFDVAKCRQLCGLPRAEWGDKICSSFCQQRSRSLPGCSPCQQEVQRKQETEEMVWREDMMASGTQGKTTYGSGSEKPIPRETIQVDVTAAPIVAAAADAEATTAVPDWNEVCKVLCKTGDGGSLCNCDLSPFFS